MFLSYMFDVSNARDIEKISNQNSEAIVILENQLKIKCGLIIDANFPYLATSLDGIVDDDFIVEIKCPFGVKDIKTFLKL
ncbi:Alkaline nuclease [Aphis craccivora]|uniref:Alkaline nuclease n=1 Tax=Aphis craccivora TaxID=307492 RepID=A0A6G0YIZ5_APHCR|nr:Alkaline nuclease [Aphis craccivora]